MIMCKCLWKAGKSSPPLPRPPGCRHRRRRRCSSGPVFFQVGGELNLHRAANAPLGSTCDRRRPSVSRQRRRAGCGNFWHRAFLHKIPYFGLRTRSHHIERIENNNDKRLMWFITHHWLVSISLASGSSWGSSASSVCLFPPHNVLPAQNKLEAHYDSLETTSWLLKKRSEAKVQ